MNDSTYSRDIYSVYYVVSRWHAYPTMSILLLMRIQQVIQYFKNETRKLFFVFVVYILVSYFALRDGKLHYTSKAQIQESPSQNWKGTGESSWN